MSLSVIIITQATPLAFLRVFHAIRAFNLPRKYTAMTFNAPFIKVFAWRHGLPGGDDFLLPMSNSMASLTGRYR
jgi:hypothetical protein